MPTGAHWQGAVFRQNSIFAIHQDQLKLARRMLSNGMYEPVDFIPLGLSDLTYDEAFLVSAFRRWALSGGTYRETANSFTGISKSDLWNDSLPL